jgi:opacity protein-like surface antigen
MANGVLHGPAQAGGLTPYAGVGAGAVRLAAASDDDLVFAYQAFGGVSKSFGQNVSAGVEYRYLDANEASFGGGLETEYDSHGVNLVLTRKF